MQHGRYHARNVLQRQHHQPVRLLVIPQVGRAHILAYQELVYIPIAYMYRRIQHLEHRKRQYLGHAFTTRPAPLHGISGVTHSEEQHPVAHRLYQQSVYPHALRHRRDRHHGQSQVYPQTHHGNKPKAFRLHQQGVRHNGNNGKEDTHGKNRQDSGQYFRLIISHYKGDRQQIQPRKR